MNPQQSSDQSGQEHPGSEYDFFLKQEKPPKSSPLPRLDSGSSGVAMRVGLIAALVFVVLILGFVIFTLINGSSSRPQLVAVAQDQNELIRVATLATTTGASQSSQPTKNFAQSAMLSLTTEQQQLLTFMASHGGKPKTKELSATKDTTTDTQLSNSLQASSFNSTFVTVMQSQLQAYQLALQSAYKNAHSSAEKKLLSDDFSAAALLSTMLKSVTQ